MTLIRRFFSAILAVSLVTFASAQDGKLKIATVDMQELFKQYYRTNEAQKQIDDPSVNESKRQTLFRDWQTQKEEGVALDRERREFLQRRNAALNEKMVQRMKGILEEIRKLVEEQAKQDNYDYVFDKSGLSASQVPFLLYTKDATDITAGLLKSLNKDAPAESLPAAGDEKPEIPQPDAAPAGEAKDQ